MNHDVCHKAVFGFFVANFSTYGVKFQALRCVGVKIDKYELGTAQTVNRLYRSTHSLSSFAEKEGDILATTVTSFRLSLTSVPAFV